MTTAAIPLTLQPASAELEEHLKPAFEVIDKAIEAHLFPVATLAVGFKGNLVLRPFGHIPSGEPWTVDAEKNTFEEPVTTACVAMLISSGQLTLDTPLYRVIPEWASGPDIERHKRVTIRQLLEHTSGLAPSFKPATELYSEALVADPGTHYQYSRSGYVLLERVIYLLSGQQLAAFAHARLFEKLGRPQGYSLEEWHMRGPSALKELENAKRQNFVNAADMAAFCQLWLNGGIYAHNRLLHRGLVDLLTARKVTDGSAFSTGWLAPAESVGTGRYLSYQAYGYTHEWGDSLWVDPAKELFIVFMPFPAKPLEVRDRFNPTRAALHEAIIEALGMAK